MSRKTRRRRGPVVKTPTVRAHIQGRKIIGLCKVKTLKHGEFAYRGYVYQADDFPPRQTINADTTDVSPLRLYETTYSKYKHKGKEVMYKKSYVAVLYSNAQECYDVK